MVGSDSLLHSADPAEESSGYTVEDEEYSYQTPKNQPTSDTTDDSEEGLGLLQLLLNVLDVIFHLLIEILL